MASTAVVTAALSVAVVLGLDEKLAGALGILVSAVLAFPVRGAVTPNATVVQAVGQAATQAAGSLAYRIDAPTAGIAEHVTGAGADLAQDVAGEVTNGVLRDVGINPREKQ